VVALLCKNVLRERATEEVGVVQEHRETKFQMRGSGSE
jgi:hypothetical protein